MKLGAWAAAACALGVAIQPAAAQTYPVKSIRNHHSGRASGTLKP